MALCTASLSLLPPLLGCQCSSPHFLLTSQSLLEKHSQTIHGWNVSGVLGSPMFPELLTFHIVSLLRR